MREFEFSSALPVWASGCENKMNETLCFTEKFSYCKDAVFKITACNFYRVFLNGEFLGFGPARAAEGYRRTDVYRISGTEESNTLFIEVNAYRCNTLYDVNTQGLVQYELIADGETLFATGKNTRCAEFTPRNRAVMRFSYQRAFVEDYDYPVPIGDIYAGKSGIFKSLPCEIVPQAKYLPRGVNYPEYRPVTMRLIEGGTFSQTYDYFICRTRYMLNRNIGIFPLEEQKKNVNDYLCSLEYEKRAPSARIAAGQYALYRSQGSRTGFVYLSFTAFCDSEIILFFDEIDMRKTENEGAPAEICFYRNGTQNYVRMSVKAGRQSFLSFEPYAAQYIKILAVSGEIEIHETGIKEYESGKSGAPFAVGDEKLDAIICAAWETFRQNALDLLTDCPSRECAGWLCDGFFSGRAETFFTHENKAERNFLENYALAPQNPLIPNSMVDMCYPAMGSRSFIENWALFYILETEDYFRRTNDAQTVALSENKIKGLLAYFAAKENEYSLLENSSGWVFVEWSKANDPSFTAGVNFPSNMLYAAALESAGRLYGGEWTEKAKRVRESVRKFSFNGEFFEDNCVRENGKLVRKGHTSETCQYYAFYFGTADKTRYPELYKTLFDEFGPNRKDECYPQVYKSNMFIGYYLRLDYLRKEKRYKQVLRECVDYFYNMAKTTGTLWEHASPTASLCHGFASYIGEIIFDCVKNS